MASNGNPLISAMCGSDKQLENFGKAQDYAKRSCGVPVEKLPQHGKPKRRSIISLLVLLAVFALLLVGIYFLFR